VTGRWELLRALGAVAGDPADARTAAAALGLPGCGDAEHADVFVFNCPPYASVYLGAEGGLGGEGADRVAGFWRAIGVDPGTPEDPGSGEPDHLTSLLSLYASLGEAAAETRTPRTAAALSQMRRALFDEHLWPWLPGYLSAVTDLGVAALGAWAELTLRAVKRERGAGQDGAEQDGAGGGGAGTGGAGTGRTALPLALREAPPPVNGDGGLGELLGGLVAPVRSGLILTRRAVAAGAGQVGAGHRIGERRFALRAMLESEPDRTAGWLGREAARWSRRHLGIAAGDPVQQWWADRATATARVLRGQRGAT
jgi:Nitrate reductase delta subunit